MGLFDKLKSVLFEDDDETTELPVIEKKEDNIKEEKEVSEPRFKSSDLKEANPIKKEINNEEYSKVGSNENSVFQSFDEEEFDRIAAINRNRLLERDRKAREKKEMERKLEEQKSKIDNYNTDYAVPKVVKKDTRTENKGNDYISSNREQTTHRFKPSPVISPVYGILDKNYRKEDILPRASSDGTLPKVMDVDNVRRKAFGILEQEIAKNDPLKNFQSEKKEEPISKSLLNDDFNDIYLENENVIDDDKDEMITFEDDIKEIKKEEGTNHSKYDENTLESDLFNLIDSMYENREDK